MHRCKLTASSVQHPVDGFPLSGKNNTGPSALKWQQSDTTTAFKQAQEQKMHAMWTQSQAFFNQTTNAPFAMINNVWLQCSNARAPQHTDAESFHGAARWPWVCAACWLRLSGTSIPALHITTGYKIIIITTTCRRVSPLGPGPLGMTKV